MANYDLNQKYEMSAGAKRWAMILLAVGILSIGYGFLSGNAERTFANLFILFNERNSFCQRWSYGSTVRSPKKYKKAV